MHDCIILSFDMSCSSESFQYDEELNSILGMQTFDMIEVNGYLSHISHKNVYSIRINDEAADLCISP